MEAKRIEAEQARAAKQARIEAERKRAEAEEQVRVEAERKRAEAAEQARIEAERKRVEAARQARIEAAIGSGRMPKPMCYVLSQTLVRKLVHERDSTKTSRDEQLRWFEYTSGEDVPNASELQKNARRLFLTAIKDAIKQVFDFPGMDEEAHVSAYRERCYRHAVSEPQDDQDIEAMERDRIKQQEAWDELKALSAVLGTRP